MDLVKWIDAFDGVSEKFVKDEADTGSFIQLVNCEVVCGAVDGIPELVVKVSDGAKNYIGLERVIIQ